MSRIDSQQTAIQSNPGAQLSVRSRIHKPQDGVGFAHGSADVELKQLDEWIERQPTAIHRALNDPNAELIITGRTSGTGSLEINEALSHRRAEEVAKLLNERLGVRAKIVIRAEPGLLTGRDNPADRVATIRVDTARIDRISHAKPNPLSRISGGFQKARAESRAENRTAEDTRSGPLDLAISILAEVLNETTGGLTGGAKLFYDGMTQLGKAKDQADAMVVRREVGRGFAKLFHEAAKGGYENLAAASERASRAAPVVHSESYYARAGLRNTERWHERNEKQLAAYRHGMAVAQQILAQCTPAQRRMLAEHIEKQSYGDTLYDKVRNFVDQATGAAGRRVDPDVDPTKRLQPILDGLHSSRD
jgi:hypothetical protein